MQSAAGGLSEYVTYPPSTHATLWTAAEPSDREVYALDAEPVVVHVAFGRVRLGGRVHDDRQ
jgi:hypothetical protein